MATRTAMVFSLRFVTSKLGDADIVGIGGSAEVLAVFPQSARVLPVVSGSPIQGALVHSHEGIVRHPHTRRGGLSSRTTASASSCLRSATAPGTRGHARAHQRAERPFRGRVGAGPG